jgi:hypothetical protein
MIDIFIAFRQYIFDDSIIIYNMLPFDYLEQTEQGSYETLSDDVEFINKFIQEYLSDDHEVHAMLEKSYCSYNFTDKFSWSIWIKTNYTGTTAQYVFTVGRADAGGYGYGLQCTSASACNVRYGNSAWSVPVTGGEWTHIAFTKSGNTCKIYKNGTLQSTQTFSGTTPTYSDGNGVGIGCFHYSGNIYPYYGNISDFRIYASVLSDVDIAELYNKPISIDNLGNIFALEYNEI